MTEELPRFVYLRATCCKAWLAMYGLPSHAEPELAQRAPSAGWQQQPDGTWVCDKHRNGKTRWREQVTGCAPPPPGDRREQLPDRLLAAINSVLGKYYSTACHTATACSAAAYRYEDLADQLRAEAGRLHSRCRLNQKFTGQLCVCGCHPEVESKEGE